MKHPLRRLALASAITFFGIAGTAASYAAESPFDVSVQLVQGVSVVQLESVANHVELTDFNVNRGNCKTKLGGIYPLPLTFKFGDGVKLFAYSCSVKEVAVVTNQGTFTYSFGRSANPVVSQAAPALSKPKSRKGEGCYEAKLKDYQKGMGPGAPVSYDVMNEWRGECGMPPL